MGYFLGMASLALIAGMMGDGVAALSGSDSRPCNEGHGRAPGFGGEELRLDRVMRSCGGSFAALRKTAITNNGLLGLPRSLSL